MIAEKRDELFRELCVSELDLMKRKGKDYSTDADILSNFKQTAALSNRTPFQEVLSELNKKIVRMNNLQKRDEVLNESILDSLMDFRNYAFLAYCLLEEAKPQKGIVGKTLDKIVGK